MELNLNPLNCNEHENQKVNYVYQQDCDSLRLGCFECIQNEDGAFFYNLKHFIHQVEDLINQRLEYYKKGNHLYYEIKGLLTQLNDNKFNEYNKQYQIIEEIASYFEINENDYKLQFATSDKIDQHSNISSSNQISSEHSDNCNDDSQHLSQHSFHRDMEMNEISQSSDFENKEIIRDFIIYSQKQNIKELKRKGLIEAQEKCQNNNKAHNIISKMNWKQFQSYSQYYINTEYNYFYHIYWESNHHLNNTCNKTKNNNSNYKQNEIDEQDIIDEYEMKYSPIKSNSISFNLIPSKTLILGSPDITLQNNSRTTSQFSLSSNKNESQSPNNNTIIKERKNSLQLNLNQSMLQKQNDYEEEDIESNYFHECVECSIIYQSTQHQIDLVKIMFQDIKQIIVFNKFISFHMNFDPIQIFWDLRIHS